MTSPLEPSPAAGDPTHGTGPVGGAPRTADAVHAVWSLVALLALVVGFWMGRVGGSIAATAETAYRADQEAESREAARAQMPEAIKYDLFTRVIADSVPLGIDAWGKDQNGDLVLYITRVAEWGRLDDARQKAVMGVIGVAYTSFRGLMGLEVDIQRKGHPVISLATPAGVPLATRGPTGDILLFRDGADGPAAGPSATPDGAGPPAPATGAEPGPAPEAVAPAAP